MDIEPISSAERARRSVFVGNIPYEATEEALKEIFIQVGPVVSFRLVYDRETGKPKGYGFCEYQDIETAQSALRNLNNTDFNGRPLRVGVAAGESNKDDMAGMQQALGGPVLESPYGDAVEPEKAPEAISKAVASLPPEQMFELMKQMKMCIQNNPTEARNMLLQNPQLAYALLQAQIVMKIVDPQVAMAMLHRESSAIPPSVGGGPVASGAPTSQQPVIIPGTSVPGMGGPGGPPGGMMGGPRGPLLGAGPGGPGQFGPGPGPQNMGPGPMGMGPGPGPQGMGPGPQGMGPGPGPQGMGPGPGPQGMGPGPGPQGMGPGPQGMGPGPQGMGQGPQGMGPGPQGMGPGPGSQGMGPGPGPQGMGPGPGPQGMGPGPQGMGPGPQGMGPGPQRMGPGPSPQGPGPRGPEFSRDPRDPRLMSQGDNRSMGPRPGGPPASIPSSMGALGMMNPAASSSAGGGPPQDQEKAALIMQVLQLTDQQIAMLPPDQQQSILVLKEQLNKNA